ncbi:MAG: histidine kinase dimerization/phospho-acceptor domain-containing protein [bacterium]|nr:histidine kinase dimerization/phospho-acceptor domain-containing protein [bacterium]
MLDDFASVYISELKNPLNTIRGYLSMILEEDVSNLTAQQKLYLEKSLLATERAINLSEDVLSIKSIDSDNFLLNMRPVKFEPILDWIKTDLKDKLNEKKIKITIKRKYKLPLILADNLRLYQLILNLAESAIKIVDTNSSLVLSFRSRAERLIIKIACMKTISDKKQINNLYKSLRANPNAKTLNLNIYIAQKLAKAMNGRIGLKCSDNNMLRIYLDLPICKQLSLSIK